MSKNKIEFKNREHEEFYLKNLAKCRRQDSYHKALIYCLGIGDDTRQNINRIYDFQTGRIKPGCLHEGWQTSGSLRIVRTAFNLYTDRTPGIDKDSDPAEQIKEMRLYTVSELFCTADARWLWETIKLRYPEECDPVDTDAILDQLWRNWEKENK